LRYSCRKSWYIYSENNSLSYSMFHKCYECTVALARLGRTFPKEWEGEEKRGLAVRAERLRSILALRMKMY
jgi:hypothetical protein